MENKEVKIKVGDVVCLKSDEYDPTQMTVIEIADGKANCIWMCDHDLKTAEIPLFALYNPKIHVIED